MEISQGYLICPPFIAMEKGHFLVFKILFLYLLFSQILRYSWKVHYQCATINLFLLKQIIFKDNVRWGIWADKIKLWKSWPTVTIQFSCVHMSCYLTKRRQSLFYYSFIIKCELHRMPPRGCPLNVPTDAWHFMGKFWHYNKIRSQDI